jgi:hypothetical protein
MNSKSPDNLSTKQSSIKLKSSKMSEEKVKKIIQNSSSQVSEQNPLFYERKIISKGSTPLSFTQKKYKNMFEKQNFISKSRRITKYNPKNIVTKKELIIDTRNEILNNKIYNHSNRKKNPYFDEYGNKRYQTYKYKVNYKINQDKYKDLDDDEKLLINNYEKKSRNSNTSEDIPFNYQTQSGFYEPLKDHYIFPAGLPPQVTNSLYTILAMRKNQFYDEYNDAKEKERECLPQIKQLQFLMDKTPMANFYSKKKDVRIYISPNNTPLPYISLLNDDYTLSEKIRFQKIMDKLTKLKKCLEDNPKKEYDIVKEFLLSIGLYEVDNFYIEKLKKFLDFVKGEFIINPSKNIKENMLDILNGTSIKKPNISNVMNYNDLKKPKDLLEEDTKIKRYSSEISIKEDNDKTIVKSLKSLNPEINIKEKEESQKEKSKENDNDNTKKSNDNEKIINSKKKNKHLILGNKINKSKGNIKSHRVESVERIMTKKYQEVERNNSLSNLTQKQKDIILHYKGLSINLKRQKEIYKSNNNVDLDLVAKPKNVIDILEKKFKDEEKADKDMRAKTYASWDKNLRDGKNSRLYGGKKNDSEYEELKKRNMLTEYICLMKAKNNYEISKLKEKYKL